MFRILMMSAFLVISCTPLFSQNCAKLLDISVPQTPDFTSINGGPVFYYELTVTTNSPDTLSLRQISIIDQNNNTSLLSLSTLEISKRFVPSHKPISGKGNKLVSGDTATVYIELDLKRSREMISLLHRVDFEILHPGASTVCSAQSNSLTIFNKAKIILGPPLKGGPWAAIYEPSWETGHRRVRYAVDGRSRIPGRFAIDLMLLDNNGKYAAGNEDEIKNWLGYGADVLAVTGGVVASTRDDFMESPTLSQHPQYESNQATGNYISLDMGNGRFVFYEHLKPGSIRVKSGQHVNKGDVIASLGFTGQSTGPHLHLSVGDANSPLGTEGLPFVFEYFKLLGNYPDMENFGKARWKLPAGNASLIVHHEHPGPNAVIEF